MKPRNIGLIVGAASIALGGAADGATCESLLSIALPNTTITMAQTVAAGSFVAPARGGGPGQPLADLPAFCRVQATLRPSTDSNIKMELWLPASANGSGATGSPWNGKFRGTGNGGLGGGAGVAVGALANGVR